MSYSPTTCDLLATIPPILLVHSFRHYSLGFLSEFFFFVQRNGWSVSISLPWAVSTAPFIGQATVLSYNGIAWIPQVNITGPTTAGFGLSTRLRGSLLAIGEPYFTGNDGIINLYLRDAGGPGRWGAVQTLTNVEANGGYFGSSIHIAQLLPTSSLNYQLLASVSGYFYNSNTYTGTPAMVFSIALAANGSALTSQLALRLAHQSNNNSIARVDRFGVSEQPNSGLCIDPHGWAAMISESNATVNGSVQSGRIAVYQWTIGNSPQNPAPNIFNLLLIFFAIVGELAVFGAVGGGSFFFQRRTGKSVFTWLKNSLSSRNNPLEPVDSTKQLDDLRGRRVRQADDAGASKEMDDLRSMKSDATNASIESVVRSITAAELQSNFSLGLSAMKPPDDLKSVNSL